MITPRIVTPVGSAADGIAVENPALDEALARAEDLIKACHFNAAIDLIDRLIAEVITMTPASRFSETKKPWEPLSMPKNTNPSLTGLSECEYKRETLLIQLQNVRGIIINTGDKLFRIFMDIQATKREF